MTAECPTCGDDFPTENGMKVHHARVHGESIADEPPEQTCEHCGKSYQSYPGPEKSRWCSKECKHASVLRECDECEQQVPMGELVRNQICPDCVSSTCPECGRGFASEHGMKIHYGARHEQNHPEVHGLDDDEYVELKCAACGETFDRHPSLVYDFENYYCSRACMGDARSNDGDEGTSRTDHYSPEWDDLRATALERDGEACVHCGMTRDEHREEYGSDLHVHHLIPVRMFEEPENAHYIENLESVCHSCHGKVEPEPRAAD